MKEWILVLTMTLMNEPGSLNDLQMDTVTGFTSKERCEVAGSDIGHSLLRQIGSYRKQMKVPKQEGAIDFPSVRTECILVER